MRACKQWVGTLSRRFGAGVINRTAPRLAAVAGLIVCARYTMYQQAQASRCMYLRQRLNRVLVGRDEMWVTMTVEDGNDDDDDDNYEEDLLMMKALIKTICRGSCELDDEEEGDRKDVSR
jgi:hypothetical protein